MNAKEREAILIKGLAAIASNLGRGSLIPSEADSASRPLRIRATETLNSIGYRYYERVGKDNIDGWFTAKQLEALKLEALKG